MSGVFQPSYNWTNEWRQFKKGDHESFRRIYDFFYDRLFHYGTKITNDDELVEDCIQELFIKLYTHRENLSDTKQLEFYLLKSLKLTIYQKLRKKSRVEDLNLSLDAFNLELEIESEEHVGIENKRIQLVKDTVQELTPSAREILYLKFYSNLSYKEIGELLGIQPDSAKKQVYRIISRLKEILADQFLELFSLHINIKSFLK
ncbi:RNA polymerase sigma factor [Mangrovibacterium lignilyticum]|uniref:RNA polymerase sigma factor n=1 Tax=Mangrovibacterium lignilyticum TaxID=2668052 RepID=UPI0013D5E49E|nr:sigma-70 family RNA polymerase sigma factor [Mangrovibacterium lignilyticum]